MGRGASNSMAFDSENWRLSLVLRQVLYLHDFVVHYPPLNAETIVD